MTNDQHMPLPGPAAALQERFTRMKWFHSIDFGAFASSGRFKPGQPQNITLYGVMEFLKDISLDGCSFLDIGTMDGLVSFGAVKLGARRVVATESSSRETFLAAREALGLDVDYQPRMQLKDMVTSLGRGAFDVVLCSGVIYHMLNPASAFFECRKLVKENGLLLMESAYDRHSDRAAIFLNSEEQLVQEVHTYSVPTKRAILGLMRLACFNTLAVRTLASPDRITVLGRAVKPEEVLDRTPLGKRIHEVDFCDFEFKMNKWLPSSPEPSAVVYRGRGGDESIDHRTLDPGFPYHPDRSKPTVGTTAWTSPEGNK